MADCVYTPGLNIGFGRTVTWKAINDEFEAIEDAFQCLQDLLDTLEYTEITTYIDGGIQNEYFVDPGLGAIQRLTIEGDVTISINNPGETDYKLITLIIENGGDGSGGDARYNLPAGTAWVTDSYGSSVDSKPWDTQGLGGRYGCAITCIWDGAGWVYLSFSRNDIDFTATADVADIYNWR
jgi:hypothetical protein